MAVLAAVTTADAADLPADSMPPNIVYILADDLGIGDISALNHDGRIATPNIDRLVENGLTFTDAHASAAICTPSRYSILTGRYPWRTNLKSGVCWIDHPALIEPDRPTVASLLRTAGYNTAAVGKWHVGLTWQLDGAEPPESRRSFADRVDYSRPFLDGPVTRGFDWFFGLQGSNDMGPYVWLENDRATAIPMKSAGKLRKKNPHLTVGGGRMQSDFRWDTLQKTLTDRAVRFIHQQSAGTPFFLYYATTAPHQPWIPAPEFDGASGINAYADVIVELDHRVGQIVAALSDHSMLDNTLILFASDNGSSDKHDNPRILREQFGHSVNGSYRGFKKDLLEGGHRLPLIAHWPAGISGGLQCHETVGIFDLLPTACELAGIDVPDNAAEDSISLVPAFRQQPLDRRGRDALVCVSGNGMFSIRKGRWKLCLAAGTGNSLKVRRGEDRFQLFDVTDDPAESINQIADHQDIAVALAAELRDIVRSGRSTTPCHSSDTTNVVRPDPSWAQLDYWNPQIFEAAKLP